MRTHRPQNADAVPEALLQVLEQFDGGGAPRAWTCCPLGRGEQGRVFGVRGNGTDLVVKLYDVGKSWAPGAARDQSEVLTLLRRSVDGATWHGWTIRCPQPLLLCEHPLAMVMTEVPGVPLSHLLLKPRLACSHLPRSLPRAIAAALLRFWADGARVYGEINLDNVLCDPPSRSLSFIDPGLARPARTGLAEKGNWYPASHDLAYLLYATAAAAVKAGFRRPGAGARQVDVVGRVLAEACNHLAAGTERVRLLEEVDAFTRVHLARIRVSWRAGGVWRRFVRRAAGRRIDAVMRRLRDPSPARTLVTPYEQPCGGGGGAGGGATADARSVPVLRQ